MMKGTCSCKSGGGEDRLHVGMNGKEGKELAHL
jgi:hypothetical protein